MKKNYLIVSLVQVIIASAVLFPVTASSQDLPETQRLERCRNNKNRITELDKELAVINEDLLHAWTEKEIEDARTQMVFVKKIYASKYPSNEEITEIRRIAAKYNFSFKECTDCYAKLQEIIAKKIDKAMSLNRPELLAKKNEIEKQLASHRNNLIALRCIQTTFDLSIFAAGTWEKDIELGTQYFGFPVQFFHVEKNSVRGEWGRSSSGKNGKITGGSFDEVTGMLSFTFVQSKDKKTGTATLYLTETATHYKLRGTCRLDDGSGNGGLMWEKLK
jgi:hypothetical protein